MPDSISLVGLDVHAAQTHAAVLDLATGELRRTRLRVPPGEVVSFLAQLPGPVRAVYEAGPTGFGLARSARALGIDVQVVAPGKIPKASRAVPGTPSPPPSRQPSTNQAEDQ